MSEPNEKLTIVEEAGKLFIATLPYKNPEKPDPAAPIEPKKVSQIYTNGASTGWQNVCVLADHTSEKVVFEGDCPALCPFLGRCAAAESKEDSAPRDKTRYHRTDRQFH